MTRFIAYYRVSTNKQGESGLGLDAQRQAVAEFVARMPGAPPDDKEKAPALPFGMSRPGGDLRLRLCAWRICNLRGVTIFGTKSYAKHSVAVLKMPLAHGFPVF